MNQKILYLSIQAPALDTLRTAFPVDVELSLDSQPRQWTFISPSSSAITVYLNAINKSKIAIAAPIHTDFHPHQLAQAQASLDHLALKSLPLDLKIGLRLHIGSTLSKALLLIPSCKASASTSSP
ncbi:hypothetical protein OC834_006526 [Tilletia horrida]|nr:hypothetical protein OC834_006526 [Tilletia horrida]